MEIETLRSAYHEAICAEIIRSPKGYPNFADNGNKSSMGFAWGVAKRMGYKAEIHDADAVTEQTAGGRFETLTAKYLERSFGLLQHLRPGKWLYTTIRTNISRFEQYEHLAYLEEVIKKDKSLSPALGGDYIVKPDIVIARAPVSDELINEHGPVIDPATIARLTPFRESNRDEPKLILHASISCKWTIRSDRSQNTRTEALNLIRNRKGPVPHIVAVTAEPLPTRIAALALGTGDLDCVYHFALHELMESVQEAHNEDQLDMLQTLVNGHRLRDISDLPFDLAI